MRCDRIGFDGVDDFGIPRQRAGHGRGFLVRVQYRALSRDRIVEEYGGAWGRLFLPRAAQRVPVQQRRRLALHDAEVPLLVHRRIVHIQQLQHFAFGNPIGRVGKDAHDAHASGVDHHLERARIEEIADQHAGRIAEARIGRRSSAVRRRPNA